MASKGQKFRSYSAELKQTILKEYFDGAETTLSQLFSRHLFACHSLFKGSSILSTNIELCVQGNFAAAGGKIDKSRYVS